MVQVVGEQLAGIRPRRALHPSPAGFSASTETLYTKDCSRAHHASVPRSPPRARSCSHPRRRCTRVPARATHAELWAGKDSAPPPNPPPSHVPPNPHIATSTGPWGFFGRRHRQRSREAHAAADAAHTRRRWPARRSAQGRWRLAPGATGCCLGGQAAMRSDRPVVPPKLLSGR
jgi:hypothetical protein